MKEFKVHEIQQLINACYEAVDRSKAGPMLALDKENKQKEDEKGCPLYSALAYNTFINILNSVFPKNISGDWDMSVKENK